MTRIELERISIKTPCPKSWDEMQGDARTRFCTACSLHVHNLSALTRAEGESLVRARSAEGGRLCVTYARRADGTVVTADATATARRERRFSVLRAVRAAAALAASVPFLSSLAGVAALAGCRPASADPEGDPGAPVAPPPPADPALPRITGDMALPEPVLTLGRVALDPAEEPVQVTLGEMGDPLPDRD